MIDKINHYSITNPASVYDEEAMTALELAGRTSAKVNECVDAVNEHEKYTEERLDAQDKLIPEKVKTAVQDCIEDGSFDEAISEYAGELEERLDNIVANAGNDNTEVVDIRVDEYGNTYETAGNSVRGQVHGVHDFLHHTAYQSSGTSIDIETNPDGSGGLIVHFGGLLAFKTQNSVASRPWSEISEKLGSAITIDGENASVKVGIHQALVYNVDEHELYLRTESEHLNSIKPHDYILLRNAWDNAIGGDLLAITVRNRVKVLEARLATELPVLAVLNGFAYITSGGSVSYVDDVNGNIALTLSKKLAVRFADANVAYDWEDVAEHVTKTIDGDSITITVPTYNALVFNTTEQKLRYRSTVAKIKRDDFILTQNAYGKMIGGYFHDVYLKGQIDELAKTVANLPTDSGSASFVIPDSVKRFAGKIATASDNAETFVFFTDPHLCEGDDWKAKFDHYMTYLKNVVDSTPASLVISGGDWIGNSDSKADACFKLGYVDGQLRKLFGDRYISVIGNHDTNYQGDAQLSEDALNMLWHREHGRAYFTYETRTTKFIVLDTDVDWIDYQNESYFDRQRVFLRDELMNTNKHVIVVAHMYTIDGTTVNSLSADAFDMCSAYNNREEITIGTIGMSFANGAGYVEAFLTGHTHKDLVNALEGSPVVIETTHMRDGGVPSFDLALIDYDARKLHLVREGTGSDRTITLDGDGETGSLPDNSGSNSGEITVDGQIFVVKED